MTTDGREGASASDDDPDVADGRTVLTPPGRRPKRAERRFAPAPRRDPVPTRIAALGLAVALVALGLGLRTMLFPGTDSCQTVAWNALPAASDLPNGWTLAASDFTVTGVTSTLNGPTPSGGSGPSSIYTTVSCFGGDASEAVSRSRAAASAAGETVRSVTTIGDEGYSTSDTTSGGAAIHFRRGNLVGYAATDGTASEADLQAIAVAFDEAMQRAEAGGTPPAAAPRTGGPGTSPAQSAGASEAASPSASTAAAPELEALLPETVGGVTLTRDSALGTDVLNAGSSGRALAAALRSLGATPDQLHVAEAYDPSGSINLSMLAFGIAGLDIGKLRTAILDAWLSATGPGVTASQVTLSGHQATKVDYGDKGSISYVVIDKQAVVVIETTDQSVAAEAAAALR